MDIKKAYNSYNTKKYQECFEAWDLGSHEVFNKSVRPDDKIMVRDEHWEDGKLIPAVLEDMEVNRMPAKDRHRESNVRVPPASLPRQ